MPKKRPHDPSRPLPDGQQEHFCQGVARGASHAAAYRDAWYENEAPHKGAYQLLATNSDVRARIDYLKSTTAKRAEITRDDLVRMASDLHAAAFPDKAYGPATSALKELRILTGHRIERRDVELTADVTGTIGETPMSREEFEQRYNIPNDPPGEGQQRLN